MKKKFKLTGVDCAECAAKLEERIQKVEGMDKASYSFMTEKLVCEYDESLTDMVDKIRKLIAKEEPDAELKEM